MSISVLVDAKTEYTRQLIDMLRTPLLKGIISLYNEAKDLCMENNKKNLILKTFQNMLSCVPKWTQEILDDECKRIIEESQCDWLDDLLTAIFISHTKILTTVRTTNKNKKINLKIPRIDVFVHKTYIELARAFWSTPYLLDDLTVSSLEYQKNLKESEKVVEEGIESTIRKLVPVQEILKKYLSENNEEDDVESVASEEEEEEKEEQVSTKKRGGGKTDTALQPKEEVEIFEELPKELQEEQSFEGGGDNNAMGTELNLDTFDTVDINFDNGGGITTESTYQPPVAIQHLQPSITNISQDVLTEIENFHINNGKGSPSLPMMEIPSSPPRPAVPSPPPPVPSPSPQQFTQTNSNTVPSPMQGGNINNNGMTVTNTNGLTAGMSPVQIESMTMLDLNTLGNYYSPSPQQQPQKINSDPKNFNFF